MSSPGGSLVPPNHESPAQSLPAEELHPIPTASRRRPVEVRASPRSAKVTHGLMSGSTRCNRPSGGRLVLTLQAEQVGGLLIARRRTTPENHAEEQGTRSRDGLPPGTATAGRSRGRTGSGYRGSDAPHCTCLAGGIDAVRGSRAVRSGGPGQLLRGADFAPGRRSGHRPRGVLAGRPGAGGLEPARLRHPRVARAREHRAVRAPDGHGPDRTAAHARPGDPCRRGRPRQDHRGGAGAVGAARPRPGEAVPGDRPGRSRRPVAGGAGPQVRPAVGGGHRNVHRGPGQRCRGRRRTARGARLTGCGPARPAALGAGRPRVGRRRPRRGAPGA